MKLKDSLKSIYSFSKNHYYLVSSLFIFLSFPSSDFILFKGFPFFAWISMIPLFHYLAERKLTNKEIYQKGFITFFPGILMAFGWIWAFGGKEITGRILVLIVLIPMLTVFFATRILVAEKLSRLTPRLRGFIYPAVWILFDYIQTIGYLAFPWTFWGYSQYLFDSLVQLSAYTGIMGITYIIILFNSMAVTLINHYKKVRFSRLKKLVPEIVSLIVILSVIAGGKISLMNNPYKSDLKPDMTFSLVQSCINPWDDWLKNRYNFLNELRKISYRAVEDSKKKGNKTDFVIWSESATLDTVSYHYRYNKLDSFDMMLLDTAAEMSTPLFTGEIGVYRDYKNRMALPQNSALLVDKYGQVRESYNKIHLCPFGEWFPYKQWLPWVADILYSFGASNFYPGKYPKLLKVKDHRFGPLICYEGMFFNLSRKYKQMGADFLVNITNDGWTDYYAGHMQHFAASKFRAVENGIWYIRVGNTGFTTAIDPYGRLAGEIPILIPGFLNVSVNFSSSRDTFYTEYGDIIPMGIILITFIIIILLTIKKYKLKPVTSE